MCVGPCCWFIRSNQDSWADRGTILLEKVTLSLVDKERAAQWVKYRAACRKEELLAGLFIVTGLTT